MHERDSYRRNGPDALKYLSTYACECCPQRFVSRHDLVEGTLQDADV
jgi:hypothetical protein